ncbi:acyltransferase family protein [Neorhodopirellula pilleata]|uniref:Acyltransferase family protein n=1 Tax=Neorhodopirellula pilleata TaxID=2714738 RepID=A0A5C6AVK5_9BACT|nr:acyltransferase [Neorhodopirellula pilleata]TWU04003.1 Acyltransferase family protein [Neorhodopirellula pilleata]
MSKELSVQAQQAFQVVALLATVCVVGIHYKSDIPDSPAIELATWNQLTQEFLFGAVARVAVPLFAFAAGLFYFRSDDGSWASYRKKLRQRTRTVAIPYLLIGAIAIATWLIVRVLEKEAIDLSTGELLAMWVLRPPAEQLWFLRDLMVLVIVAPVIRRCVDHPRWGRVALTTLLILWVGNYQCFPVLHGWYVLNLETLLFFSMGCMAVQKISWLETLGRSSDRVVAMTFLTWMMLAACRVYLRPDFDIWYTSQHGVLDLLLHQSSILVGMVALFMIAWRLRYQAFIGLSGASFFVYLVHEFPLRAVVSKIADKLVDPTTSCWLAFPLVTVGCYAAALIFAAVCPKGYAWLTGGRLPGNVLHGWSSKKVRPAIKGSL